MKKYNYCALLLVTLFATCNTTFSTSPSDHMRDATIITIKRGDKPLFFKVDHSLASHNKFDVKNYVLPYSTQTTLVPVYDNETLGLMGYSLDPALEHSVLVQGINVYGHVVTTTWVNVID